MRDTIEMFCIDIACGFCFKVCSVLDGSWNFMKRLLSLKVFDMLVVSYFNFDIVEWLNNVFNDWWCLCPLLFVIVTLGQDMTLIIFYNFLDCEMNTPGFHFNCIYCRNLNIKPFLHHQRSVWLSSRLYLVITEEVPVCY